MEIFDVILVVLYIIVVYSLAFVIRSLHPDNELYRKYFIKGLSAKLFGGFAFALVYTYYYDYGGDTMTYYADAQSVSRLLFENPISALKLLWNPVDVQDPDALEVVRQFRLVHTGSEFVVVRTAAILNILALNSYYSTTILFAALSYAGVWHFYVVFAKRYPEIKGQLAWAFFFIPSVFFWGSGVMKDSLVIGFLGIMIYAIDRFLQTGVKRFLWGIAVVLSGMIIFYTKAYVVMSLVPALLIWVVLSYKDRIRNKVVRTVIVPFLLVFSAGAIVVSVNLLGQYQAKYSVDNFFRTADSMQNWHYVEGSNTSDEHGRGSSYTLGEYDPSLWGAIKVFPAAVNVTLFRPYFWEVKNMGMLAGAIESFLMLLFTLFIFIGLGFFRIIKLLGKDPFLLMCVSFAIFFAFAVGFTSYNFGALARYKIPCIPFFVASMLILNQKVKDIKEARRKAWRERNRSEHSPWMPQQAAMHAPRVP